MSIYAWVKPAFLTGNFLLDHTWVTSYDIRVNTFGNIDGVTIHNEKYWFCKGDFCENPRLRDPIVNCTPNSNAATCLVKPNDKKFSGTIHVYGVDGVCHQVANQVLYVTSTAAGGKPSTVSVARGYKLSSLVYNTYGRREAEWNQQRINCGVVTNNIGSRSALVSLLVRRMTYTLNIPAFDQSVVRLELMRRALLIELDEIGYRRRTPNETSQQRVVEMNSAVNRFLRQAENSFTNDVHLERIFGIHRSQEAFLIDPELFQFPNPDERPNRSSALGW